MSIQLLCRKVANTQIFMDSGECISVTVLEAGSNTVVQKKTEDKDGYSAIQLGFQERKAVRTTKPQAAGIRRRSVHDPKPSFATANISMFVMK